MSVHICDLHTHSTASDGQYTPAELVGLAKDRGIEVLALTDHDNLDGLDEAVKAGEALGVRVVRGVELSADDYPSLHILGYGFPPAAPGLREMIDSLKQGRGRRKYKIRDFLRTQGVEVDLSLVEAYAEGGVIGRPHFARALVEQGYVGDRREAFDRYLDTPAFQKFDRGKPSAEKCVGILKAAGAKVSLAHPYQIVFGPDAPENLEQLVARLAGYGLDALECYYPSTPQSSRRHTWRWRRNMGCRRQGEAIFMGRRINRTIRWLYGIWM